MVNILNLGYGAAVLSQGIVFFPRGTPQGRGQPVLRPTNFGLITLPLVISYALLGWTKKLKSSVLVRSVHTSHACNFQDAW